MFDIGFSEIVVIAVVALIVIGPERLPKVARTLGHLFGRLQRYVNEVKADINREMELDELRKLKTEVQSAARDIEQSMTQRGQRGGGGRALGRGAAQRRRGGQRGAGRGQCRRRRISCGPAAADAAQAAQPAPANAPTDSAEAPRQAALPGSSASGTPHPAQAASGLRERRVRYRSVQCAA